MYTIYTQNLCGYCILAKRLLEEKGHKYKEINISENESAKQLLEKHNYTYEEINISKDKNAKAFLKGNGYKTVPQIFYNGTEYIGDYTMFKERLNKQ